MIYLNIYSAENGKIVAMCDGELLGKVLRQGKLELDLAKYASFYKGELMDEKKAMEILAGIDIYSANVVGERSIKVLWGKIKVSEREIKHIKKVPFVHIYTMM